MIVKEDSNLWLMTAVQALSRAPTKAWSPWNTSYKIKNIIFSTWNIKLLWTASFFDDLTTGLWICINFSIRIQIQLLSERGSGSSLKKKPCCCWKKQKRLLNCKKKHGGGPNYNYYQFLCIFSVVVIQFFKEIDNKFLFYFLLLSNFSCFFSTTEHVFKR